MSPFWRKLAVVLVGSLLFPAAAALCPSAASHDCAVASHACCKGPRLSQCECGDHGASAQESEPAQRLAGWKADSDPVALTLERPSEPAQPRLLSFAVSPRVPSTSERLSVLATLLI